MPYIAEAQLFEDQVVISDTTNGTITSGALVVKGGVSANNSDITGSIFVNNINITPNSNDIVHEIQHVLSNNVAVFTDIPDFYFDNTVTGSFKALVSITVSKGISEYSVWELYGVQTSNGWTLTSSFTGDTVDITFRIYNDAINNRGKIQYTNGNTAGTTTIKFRAVTTQPPGSYSTGSAIIDNTKGSYITDTIIYANRTSSIASSDIKYNSNILKIGGTSRILLENTSSFTNFSNGGAITSMGDASIAKNLMIGSKIGISKTNPSFTLDVSGDINFTGNFYKNGNPYSGSSIWDSNGTDVFYTAGNVAIGTTAPGYRLDISGTVRSDNISSTNITTTSLLTSIGNITNIISTNASASSFIASNIHLTNITVSNGLLTDNTITSITSASFIGTDTNLINVVGTNVTSGSIKGSDSKFTNTSIGTLSVNHINAVSVSSGSFVGDLIISNNSIGSLLTNNVFVTSITSGSINSSIGNITNVNSSNLNSNNVFGNDMKLTNGTVSSIVFTHIDSTSITSGSFKVNNVNMLNMTTSTLLFTNAHGTSISSETFVGSNGSIRDINATNITSNSFITSNVNFTNSTIESSLFTNMSSNAISSGSFKSEIGNFSNININSTNGNTENVIATNSNITNTVITTGNLTNLNSNNITSGSFIGTNANFTNNTFSSLVSNNMSASSITTSSFITNNASLTNATFASILLSNVSGTAVTSGSFFGTDLNSTNVNSIIITTGSLNATSGTFSNGTLGSSLFTNVSNTSITTSSFVASDVNLTNITTSTHILSPATIGTIGSAYIFTVNTSGNYQIGSFYLSSYQGMEIRNTLLNQDSYFNLGGNDSTSILMNVYRSDNLSNEYVKMGFVDNRIVLQGDGALLNPVTLGTPTNFSALSVNTSGNVGINNISTSSEKIYVNGTAKFNSNITFGNFYSGGGTMGNHLIPSDNITYDLGSPSLKWRSVYLSGNTIYLGDKQLTLTNDAFVLEKVNATSTTNATSTASGSVVVSGGVGINKDLNIGENLYVTGNLTVSGTTSSLNTNTITIKDNLFILNSGPSGLVDGGILVKRYESGTSGSINYAGMIYKESSDEYIFATTSSDPGSNPVTVNNYIPIRTGGISIQNTENANGVGTGGSFNVPGGASILKNVYIGGKLVANGKITAASDIRLKENIQTIKNPLEKIENLRAVKYNKKDSFKNEIGFIAQELETIFPQLVKTNPDGYKSVAYGNMSAVLLECIKELENQIQEIKMRLN